MEKLKQKDLAGSIPAARITTQPVPRSRRIVLPTQSADKRQRKTIDRDLARVDVLLFKMFKQLLAGEARWPLFLYGSPGTGKSCAALALCDIVPGSYYLTAEDAAEAVLHGTRIVWDVIQERRLVVLDEIGCRENVGDLHYQALKRVADLRDHMATVYVSNLAPGSIATKYDERIASRLLCGSVYELAGDDRRME